MAVAKTNYFKQVLNLAMFAHATMPAVALYVGIVVTTPTAAGTATELYNGLGTASSPYQGYARRNLSDYFPSSVAGDYSIANDVLISWVPSGDNWTIAGLCAWDAANRGAGNMLLFHALPSPGQTVVDGQTFSIPAGGWIHTED